MTEERVFVSNALEATIRIGILLLLAAWCFQIVQPFIIPIVWGIIIAIGTYPAFLSLQRRLGGRRVLSATLITLIGLLILIVPTVMLRFKDVTGRCRPCREQQAKHVRET